MATPGKDVDKVDRSFQPQVTIPTAEIGNQSSQEQPQVQFQQARPTLHGRGGYECEFVQPPPEALQTDCSICLQVLREPHLISCCGHNFCQTCITCIKTDHKSCPLCNATHFSLMHNKGLERALKEFRVQCTYAKLGCKWVDKLALLDDHLNLNPDFQKQLEGCSFVEMECNHKCGDIFRRCLLAQHQREECPKRPYSCDYCREYKSTFDDVANNHWPECKCYPLPCPNHCTPYAFERQNFEDHLNNDCPLTVVNCDFHYTSCEVQLPRKDMPAHLREHFTHVSLLATKEKLLKKDTEINKLSQELKDAMKKLYKKNKEQKLYIDSLKENQRKLLQEISELKSELTKKHDESVQELKAECAALRQEIDTLKQKQDEATTSIREEKVAMKQEIRLEMNRLKEKQEIDTQNLAQDMTDLREKQEQDSRELERQATTLQHANAHIGLVPFQITMSDFEKHKAADDKWYSEPFFTHPGGYKMCLNVYANGCSVGQGTHISVYVVLMRGVFDDHLKWPLLCAITIQLLSQKENEGYHEDSIAFGRHCNKNAFRVTAGERAEYGWGKHYFMSHTELYSHHDNFIKDGSIRFRITKIALKE